MKLAGLALPGYACTSMIWQPVQSLLETDLELTLVDWPQDLTPHMNTLQVFADWLCENYPFWHYDVVIGHSMGGLVAVQASTSQASQLPRVVLVESFLIPPGSFFQNLVMPDAAPDVAAGVRQMMQEQRAHYSPALSESLRNASLFDPAILFSLDLRAIYGDRGSHDAGRVRRELHWPDWLARIPVGVAANACHFPMLENPDETARLIKEFSKHV